MQRRTLHAISLLLMILAAGLLSPLSRLSAAPTAAPGPEWRQLDVSLTSGEIIGDGPPACFDPVHPNILFIKQGDGATLAYDWAGGQRTVLNSRSLDLCGPDGLLFSAPANGASAWRFSLDDPAGRAIEHMPTHAAQDGSRIVYALESSQPYEGYYPGRLWASLDGGLTWAERGQEFAGQIVSLALAQADGRAIYAGVAHKSGPNQYDPVSYTIHFSADAGASWEQRGAAIDKDGLFNRPSGGLTLKLSAFPGPSAPVDGLSYLTDECGIPDCNFAPGVEYISLDGARSSSAGAVRSDDQDTHVAYTGVGMLYWSYHLGGGPRGMGMQQSLCLSTDNNQTCPQVPLPAPLTPTTAPGEGAFMIVAPAAPANVFMSMHDALLHSADGGRTWQQLAMGAGRLYGVTPYLPLSVIWQDDQGKLHLRELGDAGGLNPGAVQPTGAAGVSYFAPTGHNMYRMFKAYWDANGGLAQFGYPITEPLREVTADGKAYIVQYFQRNRFEYHPENQPPYDVLLGRLGSIMSEPLRRQGHGAFNRFDDMHYEHGTYFPQTGHNLRNDFLDYWQAHGGLALYGYPISEEFEQVSLTDSKTYIVQYFERNRFEYHPENAGTPNEVLLGLLGNEVLKQRGWIK